MRRLNDILIKQNEMLSSYGIGRSVVKTNTEMNSQNNDESTKNENMEKVEKRVSEYHGKCEFDEDNDFFSYDLINVVDDMIDEVNNEIAKNINIVRDCIQIIYNDVRDSLCLAIIESFSNVFDIRLNISDLLTYEEILDKIREDEYSEKVGAVGKLIKKSLSGLERVMGGRAPEKMHLSKNGVLLEKIINS